MLRFLQKYDQPNTAPRHILSEDDVVKIVYHELEACKEMSIDILYQISDRMDDIRRKLSVPLDNIEKTYREIDIEYVNSYLDDIYKFIGTVFDLIKSDVKMTETQMSFRMKMMRIQTGDEEICRSKPVPSDESLRQSHREFLATYSENTHK